MKAIVPFLLDIEFNEDTDESENEEPGNDEAQVNNRGTI